MKRSIFALIIAGFTFSFASASYAERINGLKTWVANDRSGVGMLHYDALSNGRWGWTTNGNVFYCTRTGGNDQAFTVELYCPQIDYRFVLTRTQLSLTSQGGTVTYPGQWDDRRFWYYNAGGVTGRFFLKDRFEWEEDQWTGSAQTATYHFKETSRDDNYIYINDASRDVWVALGNSQTYIKFGNGTWSVLYSGTW
jgi:hypothetical protein